MSPYSMYGITMDLKIFKLVSMSIYFLILDSKNTLWVANFVQFYICLLKVRLESKVMPKYL